MSLSPSEREAVVKAARRACRERQLDPAVTDGIDEICAIAGASALAAHRGERVAVAGRRWQHVKRGSTYVEIGTGRVQAECPLIDMAEVVIYRSEHDGSLWARRQVEFFDGRFETLAASPSPSSTAEAGWRDIATEAQFLCDRLDELVYDDEELARQLIGHVEPSHARLKALLRAAAAAPPATEQGAR